MFKYISISALFFALLPAISNASLASDLDAQIQKQAINRVKEYCVLMQEFSGDVEKIENLDKIFSMCENSNVSVFNDLEPASTRDITNNSMPLQQYMMILTDKYDNNVKTSYSGYKFIKAVVQPSPLKEFDAVRYALIKVDKQVITSGFKSNQHLNIIVNTSTMKVSSTISEDYEDPQKFYIEGLEKFNDGKYDAALPLFEKASRFERFPGRYRAKTMMGWILSEQKQYQMAHDLLRVSAADDPLGGIILASKILLSDNVPVTMRNSTEGAELLKRLGNSRDKEIPIMHLMAKAAVYDAMMDLQTFQPKFMPSGQDIEDLFNDLISDPLSTEPFKVRGYILRAINKTLISKDPDRFKEALKDLNMAEALIKTAKFAREDFERIDTHITILKSGLLANSGDNNGAMELLQNVKTAKPYIAPAIALSMLMTPEPPSSILLDLYRKGAESGDPFSTYIVSLSYYPSQETMNGVERLFLRELLKIMPRAKGWYNFVSYLLTDGNQDRSVEKYNDWNQKAINLGEVNAMEDRALFEAAGTSPFNVHNIDHALELACKASASNMRTKNHKCFIVHGLALDSENLKESHIPYEQSQVYKTLKRLDEEGNGVASFLLYCDYGAAGDSQKAKQYLERSKNAKCYFGIYSYAWEQLNQGDYEQAFQLFNELTIYPYSLAYGPLGNIEKEYRHDYASARNFYNRGRKDENDYACFEGLSDLYKDGLGCEKNLKIAKDLMVLAIGNYKIDNPMVNENDPDESLKRMMEKKAQIEYLMAGGQVTDNATSPIAQLNQILDTTTSEDERITLSQTLLKALFASPKTVVTTIAANGQTVVATETAEDFLLRLATIRTDKRIVEVSSQKDKDNKYTNLSITMK